jgi:hypothetical protein
MRGATLQRPATAPPSARQERVQSTPSLGRVLGTDSTWPEAHAKLFVCQARTPGRKCSRSTYRLGARRGIRYPTPRRGAQRRSRDRCFILRIVHVLADRVVPPPAFIRAWRRPPVSNLPKVTASWRLAYPRDPALLFDGLQRRICQRQPRSPHAFRARANTCRASGRPRP